MRFSLAALALSLLSCSSNAVLYGDEGYAVSDGMFWAFYSGGIAVIDPDTCKVETTLSVDNSGAPLPASWSDGIYMQYDGQVESRRRRSLAHNAEQYILINSRINRENDAGDAVSDVYVIDTKTREVTAIVETGPRIVHSYGVHKR
jgi:DNA-binding beta-propeller fold protein YncE